MVDRHLHSSRDTIIVSVPQRVGGGIISPSAFRRRIVRYWHWHPLGCRAIELGNTAPEGVRYIHQPSYTVAVARNSRSRAFLSVVDLCALLEKLENRIDESRSVDVESVEFTPGATRKGSLVRLTQSKLSLIHI